MERRNLEPMAQWLECPQVKGHANEVLANMGITPELKAEALADRLWNTDAGTRQKAALALRELGGVATPFWAAFAEHLSAPDAARRRTVAETLAFAREAAAPHADALARVLRHDEDGGVREAAGRALSSTTPAASAPHAQALAEEMQSSRDPPCRAAAASRLRLLGPTLAALHLDALARAALDDRDVGVRQEAARALGILQGDDLAAGRSRVLGRLGRIDGAVKKRACEALIHMLDGARSPDCAAAVAQLVWDSDAGVRIWAAKALGSMGPTAQQAGSELGARLEGDNPGDQSKAAAALRYMGDVGSSELRQRLDCPDELVRNLARLTLEEMAAQ